MSNNEKLIEAMSKGFKCMANISQQLQTWNSDSAKQSIDIHLSNLDRFAKRYNWSDEEKLDNLILSLRGQARNLVYSLSDEDQHDLKCVRKLLTDVYGGRNSRRFTMRDIQAARFNPHREDLREFIIRVVQMYSKLGINKTDKSNEIIRESIIDRLAELQPEFGFYVRMNQDSEHTFDEWATWLVNKFHNFGLSMENDETMFYINQQKCYNQRSSPSRNACERKRVNFADEYQYDQNYEYDDNYHGHGFNDRKDRFHRRDFQHQTPYRTHFQTQGRRNYHDSRQGEVFQQNRWERPDHSEINEFMKANEKDFEQESLNL